MTRVVLPLAAVLVLGLGVYLLIAVRATPTLEPVVAGRAPAARPEPPPPPPPVTEPVRRPPTTAPTSAPPPSLGNSPQQVTAPIAEQPDAKLEAVMAEANKAYDRNDFDDAKTIAGRLLAKDPTNVRMLRIMVSASCQDGDAAVAQAHYARLPPADQAQMRTRCARFGVAFVDK